MLGGIAAFLVATRGSDLFTLPAAQNRNERDVPGQRLCFCVLVIAGSPCWCSCTAAAAVVVVAVAVFAARRACRRYSCGVIIEVLAVRVDIHRTYVRVLCAHLRLIQAFYLLCVRTRVVPNGINGIH